MNKLNWKRYITITVKVAGYIIVLISFIYLIRIVINNFSCINISKIKHPGLSLFYIFLLSLIYSWVIFLFSLAWKFILDFLHFSGTSLRQVFIVYGRSNIAKYMPGNIFHYVGRNVLGKKLGISHSDLAVSSFLEMFLIFITVAVISAWYYILNSGSVEDGFFFQLNKYELIFIEISAVVLFLFILFLYFYKKQVKSYIEKFFRKDFLFLFIKSSLIYFLIFIISGLILVFIYSFILGTSVHVVSVVFIYLIAWLLGVITPGASGGIGVRESLLIIFLSRSYPEDITVTAVLLHRVIAISGEVVAFFLGTFLEKSQGAKSLKNKFESSME